MGSPHKAYKPRDGPSVRHDDSSTAAAQESAPAEGTLAQIIQNQELILNTLQEMKTSQIEF